MKQAQSETTRYSAAASWWAAEGQTARNRRRTDRPVPLRVPDGQRSRSWSIGHVFMGLISMLWLLVTLPFRLIFWAIAWLGRLTAVVLGFLLMVVGVALWAGPLFFVGIPLFLIGLVITLRCLD